jgi:DEAD/DEAH box helicase domain-containing protein
MTRSPNLPGLGQSTAARQRSPLGSAEPGSTDSHFTATSAVVPAPPPWSHRTGVDAVLEGWLSERRVRECVAAERTLGACAGETAPIPAGLDARLLRGLQHRGIAQLYSHQAQAIEAALAGKHVVIATPTASGKSLCLHLPVLHALLREPGANAIYLYPTKALSRDQEQGLAGLLRDAELGIPALVYDGDTPADARRAARDQSRLILTNPDMLHASILPQHTRWARIFQKLEYVVIDELHSYRGVFGSHMAHVIARLRRVAQFHGSTPRFLLASATIGNPCEHAARLVGLRPEELTLITESGAPAAERRIFLYNPPVVNAELGIRGSALKHGVRLALDLLAARVPTILFAGSRNSVEVMLKYLRDQSPDVPKDAIFGYRGGYLPDKRRAIEKGLRDGEIRCVVATNALELGIDIGDLEAVICVGYPGSVAATWQRFGRAGRRGTKSLGVLVLNSRATDQYLANQPEYVLDANAEEARIDPDNVEVLIQHLKCAAFELPFRSSAERDQGPTYAGLDAPGTRDALDFLARQGLLHAGQNAYSWTSDGSPATYVSLRSISWDNFVIVDVTNSETLAELDWRSAHTMLHEQAIYQHDAAQYQVERLDYENHKAYVRRVEPDYFTTALTHGRVTILESAAERRLPQGLLQHGDIEVVETVTGYKKIKFVTHENAGYGDVRLPDLEMHTTGFWWTLDRPGPYLERWSAALLIDALRGAGVALETVSSLALMCEPQDIGRTLGADEEFENGAGASEQRAGSELSGERRASYRPTLFLYDALPGGVGLARRIYERAEELFARAARVVESCRCSSGCPACVGAAVAAFESDASSASTLLSARKAAALALLEAPFARV